MLKLGILNLEVDMVKVDFEIDTTPPPHGLVFDGDVRGVHTGEAVQGLALSYGWTGTWEDSYHEFYHETTTEAEDWLNANIAKDGSVFSFDYGSFFYQPLEWYEEN